MNAGRDSLFPDLIKSGLERLQTMDSQRELLGLFSGLEQFRRDLQAQDSTAGVLEVTSAYVAGLSLFRVSGFWLVNPGDFSFEPTLVLPAEDRVALWRVVEEEIGSGHFARALRNESSSFVQNHACGDAGRVLFHPLKLPTQVLGMYCGILRPEAMHQVAFSVLTLLLGECTDAMATVRRTRQLSSQIDILDGLLPFCAWCKKVRNDQGYWEQIERYIAQNSRTSVTHGVCPDCRKKFLEGIPKREPALTPAR